MPWVEWVGAILYVLLVIFVFKRENEHAAIVMIGVGAFTGILVIVGRLREEIQSLKDLIRENKR